MVMPQLINIDICWIFEQYIFIALHLVVVVVEFVFFNTLRETRALHIIRGAFKLIDCVLTGAWVGVGLRHNIWNSVYQTNNKTKKKKLIGDLLRFEF